MGYDTEFTGHITVSPPLNAAEIGYLRKFANTRRMNRRKGPYFVDGSGYAGQGHDADILDHNTPGEGQPGLWCKWVPTDDGTAIEWSGAEKFYDGMEWMAYLIDHFLTANATASRAPAHVAAYFTGFTFDHVLNGEIEAQGEESDDHWLLVVKVNVVSAVDLPEAEDT
jgi:hypothetical protein